MKPLIQMIAAGALALSASAATAADKVTLQSKWVTQAQFAGYYVAKDKGFYEEEGLDVEIKVGGPDISPPQMIAGGGADVVLDWVPSALASREKGWKYAEANSDEAADIVLENDETGAQKAPEGAWTHAITDKAL